MTGFRCSKLYGNPNDGDAWSDGTYSSVRNIIVRSNGEVVTSVQFQYGLEGIDLSVSNKFFDGGKHGGTDGDEKTVSHSCSYMHPFLSLSN